MFYICDRLLMFLCIEPTAIWSSWCSNQHKELHQEAGTSREFSRTLMRFKMVGMSGRRNLPFSPGKSYNLMWYLRQYLFKSIPFCEDKFKVYVCSSLLKYSTGHQNYKWQSVVSFNKLDTFHIMSTYPSFYLCLNDLVMHLDLSI